MTYLPYIIGAYGVFASVIAWDGLSPLLRHGRLLRSIRQKGARESAKSESTKSESTKSESTKSDSAKRKRVDA